MESEGGGGYRESFSDGFVGSIAFSCLFRRLYTASRFMIISGADIGDDEVPLRNVTV